MKKLIITADDLGMTRSVNEGIAMAMKEGVLSYVSVLPAGDAFDDAARVIKELGLKEVGAHLALTEVSAVCEPSNIPSLLKRARFFNKGRVEFFLNFFLGRIDKGEIRLELKAQLDKLLELGVRITALSGHEHIQMMPQILEIFIGLAREYDIPYIRYINDNSRAPFTMPVKVIRAMGQAVFKGRMRAMLDEAGIRYSDNLLGFIDSGSIREKELVEMLSRVPQGATELVTHPGFIGPEVLDRYTFHKNCEHELSALTSPRARSAITQHNITVTTFGQLNT